VAYALAQAVGSANALNGSGITPTLGAGATAGNLLISAVVYANGSVSVSTPSGWSVLAADPGGGNFSYWAFYKVAAGGETSVSYASGGGNKSGFIAEYSGFSGGAVFDDVATDYSNLTTVVTSQGTGTATGTGTDALAIALFGNEEGSLISAGRGYSDSFTESIADASNRGGHFVGIKTLAATGDQSCTYSCTDTGDEMAGAILIAKAAGGGSTVSGVGASAGTSTASGTSKATSAQVGSSAGTSTAAAVGASTAAAVGAAAGTSTAAAVGADASEHIGSAAGTSTATAVGASTFAAAGAASGTSTAAAIGLALVTTAGVGSAAGTSTALAVGVDAAAPVAEVITPQGGHYWPDVQRDDDWKERSAKERREFLERLINGAEEAPEPVKEEIKEVIAPYQTKGVTSLAVSRSGLVRLARNQAAVERLIAVYEQFVDDEDATVLLLVA